MYSYEQRKKAVKLHVEKGLNYYQVMQQLTQTHKEQAIQAVLRDTIP